jgi:hypothetical protein
MDGLVLPFCWGTVVDARDENDLTACTCKPDCTCGKPICECDTRPLLVRQLEIVSNADQAIRQRQEAIGKVARVEAERDRIRNRLATEIESVAMSAIGGGVRSHVWHVSRWWKILRIVRGEPEPEVDE